MSSSPDNFHALQVSAVIDETHDSKSFVFEIPAELRETFQYEAGQFLTFLVDYGGKNLSRSYSLASSPATDNAHKVTIKRVEQGRISNWFNDNVKAGDTLQVTAPSGRFVLKDHSSPLWLFGGGSGITPMISILKTALLKTSRIIQLVYANRDEQSIIFDEELKSLQANHADRLKIIHNLDNRDGYLTPERIRNWLPIDHSGDYYLCGPTPFMDVIENTLKEIGIGREQIFLERFVSPADPDTPKEATSETEQDSVPEVFTVKWEDEMHQVPYEKGETLLDAAKRAGIEPPFSCEEGYCSSCLFKLVKGQVEMRMNDCLSQEDIDDDLYLGCQALPLSAEIEIDWDA